MLLILTAETMGSLQQVTPSHEVMWSIVNLKTILIIAGNLVNLVVMCTILSGLQMSQGSVTYHLRRKRAESLWYNHQANTDIFIVSTCYLKLSPLPGLCFFWDMNHCWCWRRSALNLCPAHPSVLHCISSVSFPHSHKSDSTDSYIQANKHSSFFFLLIQIVWIRLVWPCMILYRAEHQC